ncbi:MAG: AAA family ATPase, partial [Myxococcales bacterium]
IAAREVATHLGDDEAGILEVLRSTFNPRCVPPWADGKLQREARNAAERQRKPENRWAHRREEKRVIEELRAENDNDAGAFRGAGEGSTIDSTVDGLRFGTLSPNPRRQTYLIPEMEIGVGRPWGWLGKTNASKTIVIQQLEVDLAMGRPIFGKFAGPGRPVRVLHIAYEGYTKAEEDYVRLLRGTGEDLDYDQLNHYLQFAEGRRLLSGDPDETREWLLRRLEGFKGGLCVIDPLVAACRGLDENATEIADPIYALESVSKESGVAIIVAHHFGHGEKRSRGSSAIEGAFGATAYIEQFADKDGLLIPSRFNERAVHGGKRNRMGCADFELTIHDTTEDGKPWIATPEALKAGDASWALRIAASDAPFLVRRSKDARDAAKHMANIAETEQRIVTALGRAEQPWAGMTITKLRDHCSAGPDTIKEAIRRLEDAGTVVPCDLGSERYAKWRLSDSHLQKQGIPRAGKYSRGPLPIPGEVARAQ